MKILITGVAGAIGSHVAEALLDRGDEVTGIDNLDPYYDPVIKLLNLEDVKEKGGAVVIADINETDFSRFGDDVEAVFHFAAQPGISHGTSFQHYVRNNINATHALLEYARKLPKLEAFVFISTSSVYGKSARGSEEAVPRPTSPYGVTKLSAEQLALSYFRSFGLPVIVLRLFSVFGPRERPEKLYHKLAHSILTGQQFTLHEGSEAHVRSFTYVGDIVEACIRALDRREKCIGEIINIGSNITRKTAEGIRIVENVLGKKAEMVIVPPRHGDQQETEAILEKARILLDFVPTTTLEEGLEKQLLWHKEKLLPHLAKKA
jgi:nucleoside-diphosphate-sugar epimerase